MSNEEASGDFMSRVIAKAAWLIHEGRIVRISETMYYVIGRKNKHIVRVDGSSLTCTCNGYRERRTCSHIVAVSTIIKLSSGSDYLNKVMKARVERELRLIGKQMWNI
ncbi:MAG: hypothetical protein NZ954_03245 [Thermofilaceae archaeon]|nr:hypothetical protein [Thermofilaceae archaeon]MDW8004551.1 hypothetical protein [Thermofilaceae archaeon]